jgi:hypothetical protein
MNLGPVAIIMGRAVPASCKQSGPAIAMIAIPSADDCGPLQLAALQVFLGSCTAGFLSTAEGIGGSLWLGLRAIVGNVSRAPQPTVTATV